MSAPEVKKIDFSIWHPLDHMPFTSTCEEYYGGTRHHIMLSWEFKWAPKLRSKTLCLVGRHTVGTCYVRHTGEEFQICTSCFERIESIDQ